jgi:hypothetical protein
MDVLGEVELPVKIQGFSWKFTFLVARHLSGSPIFGVDFMKKTRMVLDVQARHVWFGFAPDRRIELADAVQSKLFSCTTTVVDQSQSSIVTGQLSASRKQALVELVKQYADVLTSKLGLTPLIEYTICVKDTKPVRLAPYRLSPPKMNFLRDHVQSLLQQGIVEPCSRAEGM